MGVMRIGHVSLRVMDIQAAIKKHNFKPGMYYIPWCKGGHGGAAKDPEFQKAMADGR